MDVKVHGNDVEKALKILKRQLQKENLFKEIKKRSFYEKPSEKEKRKKREAAKKRSKAARFSRSFSRPGPGRPNGGPGRPSSGPARPARPGGGSTENK